MGLYKLLKGSEIPESTTEFLCTHWKTDTGPRAPICTKCVNCQFSSKHFQEIGELQVNKFWLSFAMLSCRRVHCTFTVNILLCRLNAVYCTQHT